MHGLGLVEEWRRDARAKAFPASMLLGAGASSTPERAGFADRVFVPDDGWINQATTESCVGMGAMQAIHTRCANIGKPFTPSPGALYFGGRAARLGSPDVFDLGSNPNDVWAAARGGRDASGKLRGPGLIPYSAWPWRPIKVDLQPDPECYRLAADHDWLAYHWVLTYGTARLPEVDGLIAGGRPVTCGIEWTTTADTWRPIDGPWRHSGVVRGYHYVCLVAYDRAAGLYVAANSHGGGYGDHGFMWIARSEIASDRTIYLATPDIDPGKVP